MFQQEKPPVASLDFNEHLRNAYYNAENSLVLFQTEGGSLIPGYPEGGSGFKAKVAWERFVGQVAILVAMVKGVQQLKDDLTFKKALDPNEKLETIDNPDYYDGSGKPKTIQVATEKVSDDIRALDIFTAITDLFHRKGIFKAPVTVYGGHL